MKKFWILMPVLAVLMSAAVARGQGGTDGDGPCDSSPENPTLVLAALGTTGAALASLRVRLKARKNRK